MFKLSALAILSMVAFASLSFADDTVLKTGYYQTDSQFCSQVITWSGDDINLHATDECDVTIVFHMVSPGVYEGKAEGYDYDYRVTVMNDGEYTFDSLSFRTSGDFLYLKAYPEPRILSGAHTNMMDPTQH